MAAVNPSPIRADERISSPLALKILTDDWERDPILNFNVYRDSIANIVRTSRAKFSIGIYGEWGTGKTTLMRLVEEILAKPREHDAFTWSDIISDTGETYRLKSFLKDNYKLDWIDNLSFVKDDEKTISILEHSFKREFVSRGTYEDIPSGHSLSIKLNDKLATIIVDGDEVGEFIVESSGGNILLKTTQILTVWFNAWRYEREEQFALIAFMKTIAYAMGDLPTYKKVKNVLLRGLEIIGKDVLRHLALQYAMTEKGVKELEEKLLPKMDLLSKVDKDTIYFDGIRLFRTTTRQRNYLWK